jgi:phosphoserine aminotransferase
MKVHNYSAGPCILPQEVFEQAAQAVLDFEGSGLSILEISHRSKPFEAVMAKAQGLVKELLGAPDHYQVVFLGGGASLGFHMVPLELHEGGRQGAYANTGEWASRAIKESKLSARPGGGQQRGQELQLHPQRVRHPRGCGLLPLHQQQHHLRYAVQGVPEEPGAVICDMSSDIFSRPVNVADFALIYGGAQKNMGPAGATVYLMDPENASGKTGRKLSPMLDLKNHASKESMYNTPPVYAVYVSMLTMEWMKTQWAVWPEMENAATPPRPKLLYDAIDRLPHVQGHHGRGGPQRDEPHLRADRCGAGTRLRCAVERGRGQRDPRPPQCGWLPRQHVQRAAPRKRAGAWWT